MGASVPVPLPVPSTLSTIIPNGYWVERRCCTFPRISLDGPSSSRCASPALGRCRPRIAKAVPDKARRRHVPYTLRLVEGLHQRVRTVFAQRIGKIFNLLVRCPVRDVNREAETLACRGTRLPKCVPASCSGKAKRASVSASCAIKLAAAHRGMTASMSNPLSIFSRIAPPEPRRIIGSCQSKTARLHERCRLVASLAAVMASVNRVRDNPLLPC